jgi:glycosyltransferase involved in cell wall biosynthesis
MKPRVLVIGPGRNARGGINSVISAHAESPLWEACGCTWLETFCDARWNGKLWIALKALIKAPFAMCGKNIVHIHAGFGMSLVRKTPFILLAKLLRKKIVLHIHAPDLQQVENIRRTSYEALMLRLADAVIALSPTWARYLRNTSARVVVIPNPVLLPANERVDRGMNSRPTILYMGKVEPRKGYRELIQAMPAVIADHPNVLLRIAGHGETDSAVQMARILDLQESIEILGWVSKEDTAALYLKADIFCLPSHNEGVPMAILEAMSYRLPVVCTPVGGIPDLIISGENGIFVEPGNVSQIALALIYLLENHFARISIGNAAYETVERNCSLEVVTKLLGDLYESLH